MKRITLLGLLLISASAGAQSTDAQSEDTAPAVDTSEWACEYCVWPDLFTGRYEIGLGWVSDDAYRYEDFTGLEEGTNPLLGASMVRSGKLDYWRIEGGRLGLDSREFRLDGGVPGHWRVLAGWSEIPHRINNTSASPYSGIGGGQLDLPANWVTAFNTEGMSELANASRLFNIASERERLNLGVRFTPDSPFTYSVDYKRDMKEGVRAKGAGFMFTSAVLPAPIDYVTDQLDARIGFNWNGWVGEISYYGSFFDNDFEGLRFDNPFNPVVPGADEGQFALAPDNEFHRIGLSGVRALSGNGRLSARIGFGRMDQDEAFLPYTVNPTPIEPIPLGPLPRQSLDGEVDVLDFNAEYSTRFASGLRLAVEVDYYERDNGSPQDAYTFVTQDLYVNNPARVNLPFSYERQRLQVRGSYRLGVARLNAGIEYDDVERTLDEPADTDEISGYLRLNVPLGSAFDARFEISEAQRDGEDLSIEQAIAGRENPLLRKFIYADRDRSQVQASVTAMPHPAVSLSWQVNWAQDDYDESLLGLTDSDSFDHTLDLSFAAGENWSGHAFVSRESIESDLANGDSPRAPEWFASTDDDVYTSGAGVAFKGFGERGASLSFDYVYSRAEGVYGVNDQTAPADFPVLKTRLKGTRVRLDWPLSNGASILLDYYYESFTSEDWTLDGIEQDTVFNLLGLGEDSLDYSVDTLAVWYRAGF